MPAIDPMWPLNCEESSRSTFELTGLTRLYAQGRRDVKPVITR